MNWFFYGYATGMLITLYLWIEKIGVLNVICLSMLILTLILTELYMDYDKMRRKRR